MLVRQTLVRKFISLFYFLTSLASEVIPDSLDVPNLLDGQIQVKDMFSEPAYDKGQCKKPEWCLSTLKPMTTTRSTVCIIYLFIFCFANLYEYLPLVASLTTIIRSTLPVQKSRNPFSFQNRVAPSLRVRRSQALRVTKVTKHTSSLLAP